MTDRREFLLMALEILDEWCDKAGVPMSIREHIRDPWEQMLAEIEEPERDR
jgi:hypothetical protein